MRIITIKQIQKKYSIAPKNQEGHVLDQIILKLKVYKKSRENQNQMNQRIHTNTLEILRTLLCRFLVTNKIIFWMIYKRLVMIRVNNQPKENPKI